MLKRIFPAVLTAIICFLASACVPPELDFTVKPYEPPAKLQEMVPLGTALTPTPEYTFHSDRAGQIVYGGSCASATTTASAGFNTVTFNVLAEGTYSNCTIMVINSTGAYSDTLAISTFTVAVPATISSIRPVMLTAGLETRISGHYLNTSSLYINGSLITPTLKNQHEIRFTAPSLAAGSYTMELKKTNSAANVSTSVMYKGTFLPDAELAVGGNFACARKTDKTVWCWGNNVYGQLGNASTNPSEVPVQVTGMTTAESITAGGQHACARLSDATVKCWGYNASGQLGNNTTSTGSNATPVVVKDIAGTGTLASVASLSAGGNHTCAVLSSGGVNCWGYNGYGGLGNNTATASSKPVAVTAIGGSGTLASVSAVSAGYYHTCALLTGGGVNCWGYNAHGELGNALMVQVNSPVAVTTTSGTGTLASVTAIVTGVYHSCAIISGGTMNCWGYNTNGQLGDASVSTRTYPVLVKGVGGTGSLTTVAGMGVGQYHTCARLTDNSARCWGRNFAGQLGDNTVTQRTSPVIVTGVNGTGSLANVASIGGGNVSTCAKFTDNSIKCWGDTMEFSTGSYVFPAISNAESISFGSSHACALLTDKTVKCWGLNSNGQLGDASLNDSAGPVVVKGVGGTGTLSNVKAITVGATHNCALLNTTGNNVVCWGLNTNGQLGDGTVTQRTSPVTLVNITNATSVAAADTHTCASLSDGSAKCWGNNNLTYGKLGDGVAVVDNSTPVYVKDIGGVGNLANVTSVSVGTSHSCAVLNTITDNLRCWGRNELGQLGDTTTTHRLTPVAVTGVGGTGTLANVASVRLGGNHTCALLTDKTVKCWGYNTNGQVGDGTLVQKTSPVAITLPKDAISLGVDGVQTCAVLSDNTARCWGYNVYGQLGDGTLNQRASPVSVLNQRDIATIEPGPNRTCAILTDASVMCSGLLMDRARLAPRQNEVLP